MLHTVFLTALAVLPCAAPAAPKSAADSAEAAIRAAADAFVAAFDRGDAQAIAALWTADGTTADQHGVVFRGRKAIEAEYAGFFKRYPGAKMEIAVESVDFPTPDTAVEDGTTRVTVPQPVPPRAGRYTALHVRQGGKWFLAAVRESDVELPSSVSRLAGLGWLIGQWQAKREDTTVQTRFQWIANKSFIRRDSSVHRGGVEVSSGSQIIGWDPTSGQIASWSFDSSGGHGSARWTPSPEGWRIESQGVLADGTPTSSHEALVRVAGEDNVFGWRSFDRKAGQADLPDIGEIVLDRVAEKR